MKIGEEKEDGSKTKTVINSSRIGTLIRLGAAFGEDVVRRRVWRDVQGSPEVDWLEEEEAAVKKCVPNDLMWIIRQSSAKRVEPSLPFDWCEC